MYHSFRIVLLRLAIVDLLDLKEALVHFAAQYLRVTAWVLNLLG